MDAPPARVEPPPAVWDAKKEGGEEEEEHVFANVVRRESFRIDDIRKIGIKLSFDESVESVSDESFDGRAWYYGGSTRSPPHTSSSDSDTPDDHSP